MVAVELATGQNILLAASTYADIGPVPSAIRLSAYSTTTIAPSTNIPTAKISPNMTIFEIVTPITPSKTKHNKKEVGIAKPTRIAPLDPNDVSTTIMTRAIAVRTEPSNCPTILAT